MKSILAILFLLMTVTSAYAADEQMIGTVVRVKRTFTIDANALFSNCKLNAQSRLICEVKEFDSANSLSGQGALFQIFDDKFGELVATSVGYRLIGEGCAQGHEVQCIADSKKDMQPAIDAKAFSVIVDIVK